MIDGLDCVVKSTETPLALITHMPVDATRLSVFEEDKRSRAWK